MDNTLTSKIANITDPVVSLASRLLGERTGEVKTYSPDILVPIPRDLSIEYLGTTMKELGGEGFDLWYSYEFRCLTNQGLPVTSVIKFIIPHSSKNIIESKSFKLYCNGFTMERLGETKEEALNNACRIMHDDLSKAVVDEVEVSVVQPRQQVEVLTNYEEVTNLVDPKITVSVYNEAPELLKTKNTSQIKEYRIKYDAMRSKCRVTEQPDSGTIYVYYKSNIHLLEEGLVQYFSSFYDECHFHEECLITIYKRIAELLHPEDSLLVCALYQRRGSLDIGPCHYQNIPQGTQEASIIYNLCKKAKFAYDPNNLYR